MTTEPTSAQHPFTLTGGGKLAVVDGTLIVIYDIGNGVKVYYDFSSPGIQSQVNLANYQGNGNFPQPMSDTAFYGQKGLVHGGMVQELADVSEPTFQAMIDKRLNIIAGGNNSWLHDTEVRAILADAASNPDQVSDAEVQARIRQTDYWKKLSNQGRTWADASPAEQQQMVSTEAAQLADAYFTIVGKQVDPASNYITKLAQEVASGTTNHGAVLDETFKKLATEDPNSPWSQQLRQQKESGLQRGIDVNNKVEQIRQTADTWGLRLSDHTMEDYATKITSNQMSDADLVNQLRGQANSIYKEKPQDMATKDWAQPYMDLWSQTFEQGPTDLFNTDVQKALSGGMSLGQASETWRTDPRWANTSNGQQTLAATAAQVGQKMGFV